MTEWYYSKDGAQHGPVGDAELRAWLADGSLDASTTLIWKTGMADWLPAAQVVELSGNGDAITAPEAASHGGGSMEIEPGSNPIDAIACMKRGFDLMVRNAGLGVLATLILFFLPFAAFLVIAIAITVIEAITQTGDAEPAAGWAAASGVLLLLCALGVHFLSTLLLLGFTRLALQVVAGGEAGIPNLFQEGGRLLHAVVAGFLFGVAVTIGFVLLIIPGVYLIARYGFFINALVDRKCGISEAFQYSSRITTGNRLHIVLLLFLAMIVSWLGALAFGVGLLFAYPVIFFAWAVAYRWMQFGNRAAMDHPGTQTPMLAPLR